MMRNLLFVSVWGCLLLSSCVSLRSGYRKAGERLVDGKELPGVIDTRVGVNKFNLQLDVARNHFSGLLLVKQMDVQRFRTVFTTHFGMRVFDFEFIGDSLSVHYCFDPINKEKIIRLFKNDFSRLLGWLGENQVAKVYKNQDVDGNDIDVYRFGGSLFYRKNRATGSIDEITSGKGWRKTSWLFEDFHIGFPDRITIRHSFWPIRLKLQRL